SNTYSDIRFCEDVIDALGKVPQVNVLVDGAYYSYEMDQKGQKTRDYVKIKSISRKSTSTGEITI
uniref:hypothetical protein n=1 Tax=Cellulosilyticum ruminicola TaxID=425254 RepID=UPI0006CFEFC9